MNRFSQLLVSSRFFDPGIGIRRRNLSQLAVFVIALALIPVAARAGTQYRMADGAFAQLEAPLAVGGHVTVRSVPLVDGKPADLELERFELWAPGAKVVVYTDHGVERQDPPSILLYRGRIAGDADSLAFVSSSEFGIHGYVLSGTQKYSIHSSARRLDHSSRTKDRDAGAADGTGVFVDTIDYTDEVTPDGQTWECDVDKVAGKDLVPALLRERKPASASIVTGTATYVMNIAVDTDNAFYTNLGGSSAAVTTYVTQVVAAASIIYHRDLQTDLKLVYTGVAASAGTEPFTMNPGSGAQSTFDALVQLGQVWNAASGVVGNARNISRSAAVLMGGKTQRAGIAWTGTMCSGDFASGTTNVPAGYGGAYAFVGGTGLDGSTVPNPTANPNNFATTSIFDNNYWTLIGFTHELGHVVQSPHTHCVALSPSDAITYNRPTVDQCFSGEAGVSCYSNGTYGAVNANVPAEGGTIMSYCHLTTGPNSAMTTQGYGTAIRYLFGKSGEASHVIVDDMKAALAVATPSLSAISAPTTMATGSSATASVTAVAGLSYTWSVNNGAINSGQGTNSINFTATTNPVTITVTETNASSCSASDFVTITVTTSSVAPPTNVVATASAATAVGVTWTASAGAASYEVARSTNGTTFTIVGSPATTSYSDTNATANVAYLYEVRAVDGSSNRSAYSSPDLATTVIFTDDPLVAGTTIVKGVHLTQLRTAVQAVGTLAGLTAFSFTDPAINSTIPIKAVHIAELRTALSAARTALSLLSQSYPDPTLTAQSTVVKAAHLQEIRTGVK